MSGFLVALVVLLASAVVVVAASSNKLSTTIYEGDSVRRRLFLVSDSSTFSCQTHPTLVDDLVAHSYNDATPELALNVSIPKATTRNSTDLFMVAVFNLASSTPTNTSCTDIARALLAHRAAIDSPYPHSRGDLVPSEDDDNGADDEGNDKQQQEKKKKEKNKNKNKKTAPIVVGVKRLVKLMPAKNRFLKRRLLTDPPNKADLDVQAGKWLPHWPPVVAPRLLAITRTEEISLESFSEFARHFIRMDERTPNLIHPFVMFDDVLVFSKDMQPINSTSHVMPLRVRYEPISATRFEWIVQMSLSMRVHKDMQTPDTEMEQVMGMFFEVHPVLVAATLAASVIHLLCDLLAFKNDVSFWRGLDSLKGVSAQTVLMQAAMNVIICLYLFDNDASILVRIAVVLGVIADLWKVSIVCASWVSGKKRSAGTPDESNMQNKMDRVAASYLGWTLLPILVGYTVFSLVMEDHKGWYSWVLTSLTSCAYGLGFALMTPQLFLNWKFRSVEHLPWRALCYKALNTFIDDLFAFVIKMPTMHRLSCFRDDIVFIIYLYQRHIFSSTKSKTAGKIEGGGADQGGDKQE